MTWRRRAFAAILLEQELRPVALFARAGRTYWAFEWRIFREDDELSPEDVLALVRQRQRRARRNLDRAHAALAGEAGGIAPPADRARGPPRRVRARRRSLRRMRIELRGPVRPRDPARPGWRGTVENLQILCAPCNRSKGASLG